MHSGVHNFPEEKHSQYIFKHFVFLQIQPTFFFFAGVPIYVISHSLLCLALSDKSSEFSSSSISSSESRRFLSKNDNVLQGIYFFVSIRRRDSTIMGIEVKLKR
jgi:hypothetical protein